MLPLVNKVAVLGAGVMGAQIAAHFANCNFSVLLYDLPGRAVNALAVLKKLKPSPLAANDTLAKIAALDLENNQDLEQLLQADLIIEAVAENLAIKTSVYNNVKNYINKQAVFCTNTSGISINSLAKIFSADAAIRSRFCGVHFFNPPRYQKLVELIPHADTNGEILNFLEDFLTRYLGKSVIRANDTPNFIANRIGVFSMLATMANAKKYGMSFDTVDSLTGELLGRPKSATYRTADVVGLDTLASVINTMTTQCSDDPWHQYLKTPEVLAELIDKKYLGQKTNQGFYFKNGSNIEVYDPATKTYITAAKGLEKVDKKLLDILKVKNNLEKIQALKSYDHPQAQFLWACFRDVWQYSAYHLDSLGVSARDIDLALRWGFGWKQGPFELWQSAGWQEITKLIDDDIAHNKSLVSAPLPKWVTNEANQGVYNKDTAYHSKFNKFVGRLALATYQRQYMLDHSVTDKKPEQSIVLENDAAKLWLHNNNFVFSFKTKANVISDNVIKLLDQAVDYIAANTSYAKSLVIWQDSGDNFCAGADLNGFLGCVKNNDYTTMDNSLIAFQNLCQKLRYTNFPVIAAVKGMVLGGGTELMMHCDHVVAALESYIGLVEVGVGVIPAGGGCKEMLLRANYNYNNFVADNTGTGVSSLADIDKLTTQYYKNIATAKVSNSARDALSLGYLKVTDTIIANSNELLMVAISVANNLLNSNYTAPNQVGLRVGGTRINANLQAMLVNYSAGNFITEHDFVITKRLADIFSGGAITSDQEVSEQWLLNLERQVFVELLKTAATQARINSLLQTGRPLRN